MGTSIDEKRRNVQAAFEAAFRHANEGEPGPLNVIEAIRCALERGEGGRSYFITDPEKQTLREFVASVASVHG